MTKIIHAEKSVEGPLARKNFRRCFSQTSNGTDAQTVGKGEQTRKSPSLLLFRSRDTRFLIPTAIC